MTPEQLRIALRELNGERDCLLAFTGMPEHESHLTVHTWPEHGAVTVDAFVCNVSRDNSTRAERLLEHVVAHFGAQRVLRQRLTRAAPDESPPDDPPHPRA